MVDTFPRNCMILRWLAHSPEIVWYYDGWHIPPKLYDITMVDTFPRNCMILRWLTHSPEIVWYYDGWRLVTQRGVACTQCAVVSVNIIIYWWSLCPASTDLIMRDNVRTTTTTTTTTTKLLLLKLRIWKQRTRYILYCRLLILQIIYCCIIDCSRTQHGVKKIHITTMIDCCCAIDWYVTRWPVLEKKLSRDPKSKIVADARMCFLIPVRSTRSRPGRGQIRKGEGRWTAAFEQTDLTEKSYSTAHWAT